MRSDSPFDGGVALIHQQEGRSNMEAKDGRGTRESRVLLACLIVSCALVCDAGKAVPPPKPEYVAPSFQSASVQPSLLQDYDVPKSLSIGVTVKGKPSVFLSLIQVSVQEVVCARASKRSRVHSGSSFSHTTNAGVMLERLASTNPSTLACMHGSAWRGDGAKLLRSLAERLSA